MKTKKNQQTKATITLSESKLEELVTKIVAKRLNEEASFNAIRTLTIKAQDAALKFENDIVKTLGLVDPNAMSDVEQDLYATVMADLHQTFATAVANAAKTVARLPKAPEEGKADPGRQPKQQSASVTTVKKDLPTLS